MPEKIHLFDSKTEITLIHDIPAFNTVEAKVSGDKLEIFNQSIKFNPIYKEVVSGLDKVELHIPPKAFIKGNDFKLLVDKVEVVEGNHLAHLKLDDRFIFALVDKNVKEGEELSFSLSYDKIDIINGEEKILEAVSDKACLKGKFEVNQKSRTEYEFFYNINNTKILTDENKGFKINSVEGNNCYKKQYRYQFERDEIKLGVEGIPANFISLKDFGNQKYALLDVAGEKLYVKVDKDFKEENLLHLEIPAQAIEVWQEESDFRIC